MLFEIQVVEFLSGLRLTWGSRRCRILLVCIALLFAAADASAAKTISSIVVFSEPGFPTVESASPSPEQLLRILPGAHLASTVQLRAMLNDPATRLFVLPYGSAFPEASWWKSFGVGWQAFHPIGISGCHRLATSRLQHSVYTSSYD